MAQSGSPGAGFEDVLFWLGVLVVLVAVLGFVAIWFRRRLYETEDQTSAAAPFTLEDLREMHRRGDLNDAEFERARTRLLRTTSGREPLEPEPPPEEEAQSPTPPLEEEPPEEPEPPGPERRNDQ